ncbi:MAG: molybdopterin cofactor-binding domain-containing protein [Leadbetterella sp.]
MKKNSINRRSFIVKTGVGLGFLAGITAIGCGPVRRMLAKQANDTTLEYSNKFDENIWFEVKPDNTFVLYSPKVEMGQGVFTAFAQIVAEELDLDWSKISVVHASSFHGPIDPISTGGSLSISGLFKPLTELAANTREIFKLNAAKIWAVNSSEVTLSKGVLISGSKTMTMGELVSKNIDWSLKVGKVEPKPSSSYNYIGKSIPRIDLVPKVKGEPIFGIDAGFEGMLFGSVARPPVFGAEFVSAHENGASQMPGVIKVVIEKDFAGVVARTRVQAEDAKRSLKVEWKLPTKLLQQSDIDSAIAIGSRNGVTVQKEGKTDIGTDFYVQSYTSPLGAHAHIEPNGASASWEGGKLVVKMSTQVAKLTRSQLSDRLGISEKNIDVQSQYLGGGFGRRLGTAHAVESALMAKAVGKPVHVFFERSEEFQNGILRPPTHNILKAVVDNTGKITSLEHHTSSSDVAFNSPLLPYFVKPMTGNVAEKVLGADFGAWRGGFIHYHGIPNYKTVAYHESLPFPTSWWRGLGLLANTFAIESFMDELAYKNGKDPIQFRLNHLNDTEADQKMKKVIETVKQLSGWGKKMETGKGIGFACSTDVLVPVAQVAEVTVSDGLIKVDKVYCAIDPGMSINPDGIKAQVEGAIIMGLSATLYEEIIIKDGKATPDMIGMYSIATLRDAPEIVVEIINSGGAPKGIGEPPIGPIGAAIANAIFVANGKRIRSIPLANKLA